jgi:hypothetical protein
LDILILEQHGNQQAAKISTQNTRSVVSEISHLAPKVQLDAPAEVDPPPNQNLKNLLIAAADPANASSADPDLFTWF